MSLRIADQSDALIRGLHAMFTDGCLSLGLHTSISVAKVTESLTDQANAGVVILGQKNGGEIAKCLVARWDMHAKVKIDSADDYQYMRQMSLVAIRDLYTRQLAARMGLSRITVTSQLDRATTGVYMEELPQPLASVLERHGTITVCGVLETMASQLISF